MADRLMKDHRMLAALIEDLDRMIRTASAARCSATHGPTARYSVSNYAGERVPNGFSGQPRTTGKPRHSSLSSPRRNHLPSPRCGATIAV